MAKFRLLSRIVQRQFFQRLPTSTKWRRIDNAFQTAKLLHASGCKHRNPAATHQDMHQSWLKVVFGFKSTYSSEFAAMNQSLESLKTLADAVSAFDALGIQYVLGGSMASSIHGIERFTNDADFNVQPFSGQEEQFASRFGKEYYLSVAAMKHANRTRSSFNMINTATGFKIDIFICKNRAFDESVISRREKMQVPDLAGLQVDVATAEDIILYKLEWFRLGNEISDRQWSDILGVLRARHGQLDHEYLEKWAMELKVYDLLLRAQQEVVAKM